MARSGCLRDYLPVSCGFELVGRLVAERAVQAGAVVPADVLDGGAGGGGAGGAGGVGRAAWPRQPPSRGAKNDSASALPQHGPARPADKVTSRSPRAWR